jgi:hypothetical protein
MFINFKLQSTIIIIFVSITIPSLNLPSVSTFRLQSSSANESFVTQINSSVLQNETRAVIPAISIPVIPGYGKRNNLLNSTFRVQPGPNPKRTSAGAGAPINYGNFSGTSSGRLRNQTKALHQLHVLGLFELTENGTARAHGRSEKYAAQLAINDINRRRILKNYQLVLQTNDTKVRSKILAKL